MNNQTQHHEDHSASLESNGIVYGLAQACVEATRAIADRATPEGFISQATLFTGENDPERIAWFLHRVLTGLRASLDEQPSAVKVAL